MAPAELLQLVSSHLPGCPALGESDDLKALGLDSLALIGLLVDVEERYEVSFPDDLLTEDTFATPESLWAVLVAARGDGADA